MARWPARSGEMYIEICCLVRLLRRQCRGIVYSCHLDHCSLTDPACALLQLLEITCVF